MRILVTFAVDAEFAPWRKLRPFEKRANGVSEFFALRLGDSEINVLLTGVGAKRAWLETTKIAWDCDVDICISSGLAGALRPEHKIGDVLVANKIQSVGWKRIVVSNHKLVQLAQEQGARVAEFYTAESVVRLSSEKRELGKLADAVEMESGEVLYEATAFGAAAVAVRAISDGVGEDLPLDFNRVITSTGNVSIPRVLGEVARHPLSAPALVRFGNQSRMAAEKLCVFLDRYVEKVAAAISAGAGVSAR